MKDVKKQYPDKETVLGYLDLCHIIIIFYVILIHCQYKICITAALKWMVT